MMFATEESGTDIVKVVRKLMAIRDLPRIVETFAVRPKDLDLQKKYKKKESYGHVRNTRYLVFKFCRKS
jgi:hypothetical protein